MRRASVTAMVNESKIAVLEDAFFNLTSSLEKSQHARQAEKEYESAKLFFGLGLIAGVVYYHYLLKSE